MSVSNNNKKDKKINSEQQHDNDDVIVFQDKEKEILQETAKDLDINLENDSDLLITPEIPEDLSPKDLDKLINDKKNKTLIRDIGNNPNIFDTVSDKKGNNSFGNLTAEDIKNLKEEKTNRKDELVMQLANSDTIKLHLDAGMKDGKKVWVEREFWYNSFDQKQRFALNVLAARLKSLGIRHTLLVNKPFTELSDADRSFLLNSNLMIEVAAYRYQEFEAKLKFGMASDEYARVLAEELDLAREVYDEHIKSIPSYRARQLSSSFKGGRGATLSQMTSL